MTTAPAAPSFTPIPPPPACARITKLALAALEAGVSEADVLAHLEARGGSTSDDVARIMLELLEG